VKNSEKNSVKNSVKNSEKNSEKNSVKNSEKNSVKNSEKNSVKNSEKNITCEEVGEEKEEEEREFDSEEAKASYENNIKIIHFIESFKEKHDNEDQIELFFTEYYLLIETVVYRTFNNENNNNVFGTQEAEKIINVYQNIMDFLYLKNNKDLISKSIYFSINYILDTDEEKEEKLDNLLELYIAFDEIFILNKKYMNKLEDYNKKRYPNVKELERLYNNNFKNIYDYNLKDGIIDQWKMYFSGKRPKRYSWVFNNFIDNININFNNFYKSLLNSKKETFQQPEKSQEVERIFGGIGKAFNVFKKIPETLGLFITLLKNILNPMKMIEIIGKFIILIVVIVLKLILFTVKIKEMYLLGEYLLYLGLLLMFSPINLAIFSFLGALNFIFKYLDIYLTNGLTYRFIYWLIGAMENAPSSWYKNSGHHYGYDTCNKYNECEKNSDSTECAIETENNSTFDNKCDNYFQNKNKRMFFAYYRCGENYKPDRETKGFACVRKYEQEPGYCLQANIYRLKNNLNVSSPAIPGRFVPSLEYMKATKSKRKEIQNQYKKMKHNFYNNCGSTMQDYDGLTKNICKLYPYIINETDRKKMETLCYNAYCVNGSRDPFCYKMTRAYTFSNNIKSKHVIPRIFVISIYITVIAFIINVLVRS
jgi:hypothetical protein